MAELKDKILLNIQINAPEVEKQLNQIREATAKAKEQQSQLRKEYQAYIEVNDSASAAKISSELNKVEATLKSLGAEQRNYSKQLQLSQEIEKETIQTQGLSKQQLIKLRDLESLQLNKLKNTLQVNAQGELELTEEYKKSSAALLNYNNALIAFDQGVKDGRSNVGNYATSIKEAFTNTDLFGGALNDIRDTFNGAKSAQELFTNGLNLAGTGLKDIGKLAGDAKDKLFNLFKGVPNTAAKPVSELGSALPGIEKGAVAGARGMNVLKVAIASTGIGLLVLAIGALITAFTKTEKGAEFIERKFAAVGGVIDFLIGGVSKLGDFLVEAFVKPREAIEKVFSVLTNPAAFATFLKGMGDSAKAAEELKARQQDLEDQEIANILVQQKYREEAAKLRTVEEDRTKSIQERIEAGRKAALIEQQALSANLKLEEQKLKNLATEFELAKKNGTLRDENFKNLNEQTAKVSQLTFETNNKIAQSEADLSKKKNQFDQNEIANRISILDNRLKVAQSNGLATLNLEKQIAKEKRDQALSSSTLEASDKTKIESDYQTTILTLNKKYADDKNKLLQQAEDISINLIQDSKTKEIATEILAMNRKLEAIKGTSIEEERLKEVIREQSAINILKINDKYQQIDVQETLKQIDRKVKAEQDANQKNLTTIENNLRIEVSKKIKTEEQANNEIAKAKIEFADKDLAIIQQSVTDKQNVTIAGYQQDILDLQTQLDNKQITEEQHKSLLEQLEKTHTEELGTITDTGNAAIQEKQNAANQEKVNSAISTNQKITENQIKTVEEQQQINQLSLEFASSLVSGFADILSQDQENRKRYGNVLKVLALGEMVINLQRELAAIRFAAAANPANAITAGAAGATQATLQSAIAITKFTIGSAKVLAQQFEHGGYSNDGEQLTLKDVVRLYSPTVEANKITHGGYVSKPTLSYKPILTGEAGTEHISPSWMVKNPKLQGVYQMLETIRQTKVIPFAEGGLTAPLPFLDGGLAASFHAGNVIDKADLADALNEAVRNLPAPVTIVQDINEAQSNLNLITSRADN